MKTRTPIVEKLIAASSELREAVNDLKFSLPIAYVYNPLDYAWDSYQNYLEKYGNTIKKVVFLGMNPGPWGMAQTGVPFGEVTAVKEWLQIENPVKRPAREHPKRPVLGFQCTRSEVSGKRIWSLFQERYTHAVDFFESHFIANYCPLVFMEESGRNLTPDKLKKDEKHELFQFCDLHLQRVLEILEPRWLVGIGQFTYQQGRQVIEKNRLGIQVVSILHPSPANPAANRDWAGSTTASLHHLKIWD